VGTAGRAVQDTGTAGAGRARELAERRQLLRLWRLPGLDRFLGLWQASRLAEMRAIVASLPLSAWMTTEITPLTPHPSDPLLAGLRP